MSTTLGADFANLLGRELDSLASQIARYPDDAALWRTAGSTKNPPGTLVLHLVGNLRHYVGAVLGTSPYLRDRDSEFSAADIGREQLLGMIQGCRGEVVPIVESLSEEALSAPYPGDLPPSMAGATTRRFLLHLYGHFMWHLGQVDYHRRLLIDAERA